MSSIGYHFFVTGTVQGVFFRKYTKAKAQELGLTGWVRNLADGRVEVKAFGEQSTIAKLQDWLEHTGSPRSNIEKVEASEIAFELVEDFQII